MSKKEPDGPAQFALLIVSLVVIFIALSPIVAMEIIEHSKPGSSPVAKAYLEAWEDAKIDRCTAHRFAPLGCRIEQERRTRK